MNKMMFFTKTHIDLHDTYTVKLQTIIQQNAVIGTVAVDGWIVTFGTIRRAKRRYAETLTYLLV